MSLKPAKPCLTERMATTNFFKHCSGSYRSGLEEKIQTQLAEAKIKAQYEPGRIPYTVAPKTYTPDFVLPNGIVIETKGYFLSADRTKHLVIKAQHPNIDLRFIFQNPNQKLNKTSHTTYADWCKKHGFAYASKRIPTEWLTEPHDKTKIEAVQEVLKHTKNH